MSDGSAITFGRFRVLADRRELIADGRPVDLGTRAFDLLLALVRRPGELVTKDELMHAVWGATVVEENTLAVHLSALRKALGDGVDGARYIQTVPGRGYRFLAPTGRSALPPDAQPGRVVAPNVAAEPPPHIGTYDVFVSYASEDLAIAERLVGALEADGLCCWLAHRDIQPGSDWGESIIAGIAASRFFVLVLSAAANRSAHVRREVDRAASRGLRIIPFRIEPVKPAQALEYFLTAAHWLDAYTLPFEPHLDRLLRVLRHVPPGDSPQDEKPSSAAFPPAEAAPWQPVRRPISLGARPAIAAAAMMLILVIGAAVAWQRGWLVQAPSRPAPWSSADMRQTFAIEPVQLHPNDPPLEEYADRFIATLTAQFTPDFGPERLLASGRGAHFLIETKFRRVETAVETRVRLLDARTQDQIAIRQLTEPLGQPLDPDRVEMGRIRFMLKWAAIEREQVISEALPTAERDARDLIILSKVQERSEATLARYVTLIEAAERLAPESPDVAAEAASMLSWRAANGRSKNVAADIAQARTDAEFVLDRNPHNLMALHALAAIYIAQERHEDVIAAIDRILSVSPHDAWSWGEKCYAEIQLGRMPEAAATLDRAIELMDPQTDGFIEIQATRIRFDQERYKEAADWAHKAVQVMSPSLQPFTYDLQRTTLYAASAEALTGDAVVAAKDLASYEALKPEFHTISALIEDTGILNLVPPTSRDRFLQGLRKAGMPE
ncbi:MAG TPA: tetratricopeptide repeat protein [Stellaceae bacterium]|nr:tetratricopeptide repeat protein [Stellaceae bacterium]